MKQCIYYLITALSVLLLAASCKSSKIQPKITHKDFCPALLRSGPVGYKSESLGHGPIGLRNDRKKESHNYGIFGVGRYAGKDCRRMIEEYATTLSEGKQAASKELLQQKTITTSNRVVKGAKIVCDQWTKDEETGQYANYIVMEINPDTYIRILSDELKKAGNTVDSDLLKELFIKHISK